MWNASFTIKIIFTTRWAIYIVRVYSLQIIGWNVPEWGGKFHPQDRLFHLMSRDGGNIVLLHPRVEYSTFFIYSVLRGNRGFCYCCQSIPAFASFGDSWLAPLCGLSLRGGVNCHAPCTSEHGTSNMYCLKWLLKYHRISYSFWIHNWY